MALLQAISNSIAVIFNVVLIVVLVVRELMRDAQSPGAQRIRRLLGIACLPLLAIFIGTVVVKLSSLSTQTKVAQATTPVTAAVSPSPIADNIAPAPAPTTSASVVPPTTTAPANTLTTAITPTSTVVPTSSVAPTSSPSATPTPSGDTLVSAPLDVTLADLPTREGTTAQMRYANNSYQLVLSGQQNVGITSQIAASNYRMAVDINITEGEAGIVFLATEPDTFYRIMLDTKGRYAIQELYANAQVRNVVDWTQDDALQSTTQLRIERQGDAVQFVANNQPLTTFTVLNPTAINQFGVALTSGTGKGEATFRNLVVEELTEASR
jgi:hypothetical protein